MKKLIFLSAACAAMAMSPSEAVEKSLKTMAPEGVSIKASKASELKDGWFSVKVELSDPSGAKADDLLFSNGRYVTPMLIDAQKGVDLKAEYKAQKEKEAKDAIKKGIPEYLKTHTNYVRLGDKGGAASVVFSDPDCPFCRQHLASLEEELKHHDVVMILMPLPMHTNALNKAALLLEDIKKLGDKASTAKKLEVFKKYFANGEFATADAKAQAELSKQVEDAFNLGVNYTPAIFEDIKL